MIKHVRMLPKQLKQLKAEIVSQVSIEGGILPAKRAIETLRTLISGSLLR